MQPIQNEQCKRSSSFSLNGLFWVRFATGAVSENKQAVLRRTACLKNDLFGEELLLLGLGGRLRLVKFGHHVVREIEGVT